MSQSQELGLRAQVLDVVPPGPIHRNRRTAVTKFAHRIPNFRDPAITFTLVPDPRAAVLSEQAGRKKEETVSRLRQQQPQQQQQQRGLGIKVPLLLEQRDATVGSSGAPAAVFKGVPEAGGGANVEGPPLHYVLYRSGNRVTAFPADQWFAFKPHVDRRGLLDSVAAANAAMVRQPPTTGNAANKGGHPLDPFALRLLPKSQRLEKQRQEEEARERQEQVAAGRLLPLSGAVDDEMGKGFGASGGRLKHFVDEDELEEELFGNDDDEDVGPRFGGKGGRGGKKGGRSRSIKTADGEELGEDEVPEDLYGGPAVDEDLRPEKPEEAEDWEHEFAPDDDDQDQGQDEVYDDDPGMRKKLGIEADEEEEGEEADEQARKLKKLGDPDDSDEEEEERKKTEEEEARRKEQAAAAAAAAGGSGAAGAGGEEDEQGDEDEDELDELDEMEDEPKAPPPPPRPPSVPPPAAAKPPPAPGAAAAATGTKRKVGEESRAGADGAKRARTNTPPSAHPGGSAPSATATAAKSAAAAVAGAVAAGGAGLATQQAAGSPGAPSAAAGAGSPVTAEEVIELLRRQPNGIMPFQDFTRHFAKRTTTPELRAGLKSLTVSLCKSSKNEAGQLLVSLKK